jgi:hypothetical protein
MFDLILFGFHTFGSFFSIRTLNLSWVATLPLALSLSLSIQTTDVDVTVSSIELMEWWLCQIHTNRWRDLVCVMYGHPVTHTLGWVFLQFSRN